MAIDKTAVSSHLSDAKRYLKEKDYGNYWYSVNKAAALVGAADSAKDDEEITNRINSKLGGPGS
jgi:hypothetical protein